MDDSEKIYTDAELREIIKQRFPDKILADVSDYENEENQTYKFLYCNLKKKADAFEKELYNAHHELAELKQQMQGMEKNNEKPAGQMEDIAELITGFMEKEIVVSDVKPFDRNNDEIVCASDKKKHISEEQLSLNPGVYEFRRPSWFTSLPSELNKENIGKKTAAKTIGTLADKVKFWKKLGKKMESGNSSIEEAMGEVDQKRRKLVAELLESDLSNEEKYIKYLLLTPGMPRDFMKTLIGASELLIDANVVIELLEQPRESFNREMVEAYVSEVRKGTEYNIKKELANELIRGEWYIMSDINGSPQKYQLVPFEYLENIKRQLENLHYTVKEENTVNDDPGSIDIGDFPIMDNDGSVPVFLEEEYPEDDYPGFEDISEDDLNELIGGG